MFNWSKLVCVTDRHACPGDYLTQLRKIAYLHPQAIILREKDLSPADYERLAASVLDICESAAVPCYLHGHADLARKLGCANIHLSLPALRDQAETLAGFERVSVSCHSLADVREAEAAGACQVVLGNIFETTCKPGKAAAGLDFLKNICAQTALPVWAIGGISLANLDRVLACGAAGGCMRSGFMQMEFE
jgi:thiamine-phosphate diphosphorylase